MSAQRAPENIYGTDNSYEMLEFAQGRIKDNSRLNVQGSELTVLCEPAAAASTPDWVGTEYSRGWFETSFSLDASKETASISVNYKDGYYK